MDPIDVSDVRRKRVKFTGAELNQGVLGKVKLRRLSGTKKGI